MDTATFFEKFSLFAQAEGAAARFREVVLNLAFSGKLKGTDPSGWETHPIGDFFTEGLKSINAPESPNQTYELWSVPSFETGAPEIVTGAQVGSTKRELRDGTILLGKINPHLNRIWVVNRRTNHPMIASQEWINVTAGDKWDTGYLARLLSSPSFNRSVCATAQGMGSLTRANTKQVAQIVVHCPPLKEQQKLIAKVDELMALCDRLEAQLKERDVKQAALAKAALAKFTEDPTPENLQLLFHPSFSIEPEDIRDTILSLAMLGKLVSQKPGSAHADSILDKLATTRGSSKINNVAGSYSFSRYDLPENWRWCELGDLATLVTSGSRDWASYYSDSGAIFVRMGNLSRNSYQLRLKNIQHVKPPQKAEGDRTKLMAGDLLISITGEVGLLGLIPDNFGEAYINQHVCLVRLHEELRNRYIAEYLRSPSARSCFNEPQRGIKNSFRLTDVLTIPIPLPPLDEQIAIVEKLDELMNLISQLEAQLDASRTTGVKLLEAMVAELTTD